MKRCKLPRDQANPSAGYVGIDDLNIGSSLTVFSKELLLYAADTFTTEWFKANRGIDLTPIEVDDPVKEWGIYADYNQRGLTFFKIPK